MPHVKLCSHIKVTGVRCGSPALREKEFCYFHQRMLRGIHTPPEARLHPVALIENEEAIQSSLMELINAIARNSIDLRRADLILKALHIAVKNSRRVGFDREPEEMVNEVPPYSAPDKTRAGTDAPVKPAVSAPERIEDELKGPCGAEVSGRGSSSEVEVPKLAPATEPNNAATGKGATSSRTAEQPESNAASAAEAIAADPTQRKPPTTVKEAPKERNNAVHRASGG
jgi:hypothetical protein